MYMSCFVTTHFEKLMKLFPKKEVTRFGQRYRDGIERTSWERGGCRRWSKTWGQRAGHQWHQRSLYNTARKQRAICNQGIIFVHIRPNLYSWVYSVFIFKEKYLLKANWSDYLAFKESNDFQYKPILFVKYRFSSFYESRISLLSKIEIFKENKNNLYMVIKKTHPKTTKQKQAKHLYIMSVLLKGLVPRMLKFIQPHVMLCTDCKKNKLQKGLWEKVPADFQVLPNCIIQVNPSNKTQRISLWNNLLIFNLN